MKILPPASVIAAAAPEGETATALAEASLDWSPCLIRGDFLAARRLEHQPLAPTAPARRGRFTPAWRKRDPDGSIPENIMTAATSPTESALDSRVRRAARAAGLAVRRSRRALGVDNGGGYRLIDPAQNFVVLRERFDMTAADVIEYCRS